MTKAKITPNEKIRFWFVVRMPCFYHRPVGFGMRKVTSHSAKTLGRHGGNAAANIKKGDAG